MAQLSHESMERKRVLPWPMTHLFFSQMIETDDADIWIHYISVEKKGATPSPLSWDCSGTKEAGNLGYLIDASNGPGDNGRGRWLEC